MSLTLGEKLQQAREASGITISEIAEQTRISPHYLECIENNDYRTLPGGIFNKGFVKSYAKYVGLDEQEALRDYANLIANQDNPAVEEPRTYRPQVLTDDRANSSQLPTIVFAVIILGLMTWGILALVNYIQQNPNQSATENTTNSNANSASDTNLTNTNTATVQRALTLGETKIEFRSLTQPVSLTATMDGKRTSGLVTPDKPQVFEPEQNLKLAYSKAHTQNVQMTINGKQISLPPRPFDTRRSVIELNITNENIKQIWESGAIAFENAPQTTASPNATPRTIPLPRATPRTVASPSATPKTSPSPSATPKPTASPKATPKQ